MNTEKRTDRRGSALVFALVLAVALAGLCAALLSVTVTTEQTRAHDRNAQRSFYAAEAGLSDAYMQLVEELKTPTKGIPFRVGQPGTEVAFGPTSYWAEVSEAGVRGYSLTSTGIDDADRTRLELIMHQEPNGFFQFAAFGANGVVLDSNAFIDSYDSAYGPYASQVKGGNNFARENGHIGSNKDILLKANTEVHGDARPGPGHIVNNSAPNAYVSGSMDPLEEEFEFPPITTPAVASSGSIMGTSSVSVGPGDVRYDSILMQGGSTLTVVGPARLVVDDFTLKSNSKLIFDATAGEIEVYASGDFELESNSDVNTLSNSALDVTLFLSGNNLTASTPDTLELGANSDFIGAIYAPNSEFSLASNFNVFGSLICGRLDLSSFGEIHFDEALLYEGYGATGELESRFWHRLPNP